MNFFQAIASGFSNYVTFSGRAARSEYWYWVLFIFLCSMAANLLDVAVFHISLADPHAVRPFRGIFSLATFLPTLAMAVRRLHDVDRRGWWELIMFTIIGIIFPLLIWKCRKGTAGDNRFGPDPLAGQ